MIKSVTIVAQQLEESKPVETETIAMKKMSVKDVETDKKIELPKPKNDKLSAPKLTMKETAKSADGKTEIAPSVAIFDRETAGAIFPKPSASSAESTNSTAKGSSKSKNITYAIDSSIVSLDFAGAKRLNIEIEMSVDTSADAQKSGFE